MYLLRYTFTALIKDILWTPLWWYTGGVSFMFGFLTRRVAGTWQWLGLPLWIKHIFTPMFQQYDVMGRIISFFMRLAQIMARIIAFLVLDFLYSLLFIVWIVAPVLLIYYVIMVLAT